MSQDESDDKAAKLKQLDRDCAIALLHKMGVDVGQITLHWVESAMVDHHLRCMELSDIM